MQKGEFWHFPLEKWKRFRYYDSIECFPDSGNNWTTAGCLRGEIHKIFSHVADRAQLAPDACFGTFDSGENPSLSCNRIGLGVSWAF